MDIFGEAAKGHEGFIVVDFINGTTEGASPSKSLADAIKLYSKELPAFCERHGVSSSSFQSLTARYSVGPRDRQVLVSIEDMNGRQSADEYVGTPLRHIKILDALGRIRTKRK